MATCLSSWVTSLVVRQLGRQEVSLPLDYLAQGSTPQVSSYIRWIMRVPVYL